MNVHVRPQFTVTDRRLPFECVALVLQGGGALRGLPGRSVRGTSRGRHPSGLDSRRLDRRYQWRFDCGQSSREAQFLQPVADRKVYNLVHLIYRAKGYEGHSKDYDFSGASMRDHWREGVSIFDLAQDGRE